MNRLGRAIAFAAVLLLVLALVTATDGEHRNIARHFLSNLFRQLF